MFKRPTPVVLTQKAADGVRDGKRAMVAMACAVAMAAAALWHARVAYSEFPTGLWQRGVVLWNVGTSLWGVRASAMIFGIGQVEVLKVRQQLISTYQTAWLHRLELDADERVRVVTQLGKELGVLAWCVPPEELVNHLDQASRRAAAAA